LAPVIASRWVVMHATGDAPVITSDVGWAPYRDPMFGECGFAIPIDAHTILGLVPRRTRRVIKRSARSWIACIEHRDLMALNHESLNKAVTQSALTEIYGPTRNSVGSLPVQLAKDRLGAPEPFPFDGFSGASLAANEFTWHRLVSSLRKSPTDPTITEFNLDFADAKRGWYPHVILPLNLPKFHPALRLVGDAIEVALHTVLVTSPSRWVTIQDVPIIEADPAPYEPGTGNGEERRTVEDYRALGSAYFPKGTKIALYRTHSSRVDLNRTSRLARALVIRFRRRRDPLHRRCSTSDYNHSLLAIIPFHLRRTETRSTEAAGMVGANRGR